MESNSRYMLQTTLLASLSFVMALQLKVHWLRMVFDVRTPGAENLLFLKLWGTPKTAGDLP